MLSKFAITVSVGEPPIESEIIGIVHFYISQQFADNEFGKKLFHNQIVDESIKKLVKEAIDAGANSIYNLRINLFPSPGAMAAHTMFHLYGTAVKTTQN